MYSTPCIHMLINMPVSRQSGCLLLLVSPLHPAPFQTGNTSSFLQDDHWSFGMATCKMVYGILYTGMFASVFFLSAISVDRYLLTLHPVWSQLHRTPHWASSIILGVWISATALSIPALSRCSALPRLPPSRPRGDGHVQWAVLDFRPVNYPVPSIAGLAFPVSSILPH